MLCLADAIVAQSGSIGTFGKLFDALARKKPGAVSCPIVVLNIVCIFVRCLNF